MRLRNLFHRRTATDVAGNLSSNVREHTRCGQHLSGKAALIETGIQLSGYKRWLSDTNSDKFAKHLEAAKQAANAPFAFPPKLSFTSDVEVNQDDGITVVQFNRQSDQQPVVLYLYGGAFVDQPQPDQWGFCDRLAQESGARIIVPLYPLVPGHQYKDDYQVIDQLYHDLMESVPASQVTLLGDSAGGLLALGFAESLGQMGLPQPGHVVLFSPWLDIKLNNPLIEKCKDQDVMLAPEGLRRIGQMWAGRQDPTDYHLSPINGDLKPLRDVHVYVGTNEIMAPDVIELDRRLRHAKVKSQVTLGRGLFHTYPVYDFPEGREVVSQVAKVISTTKVNEN